MVGQRSRSYQHEFDQTGGGSGRQECLACSGPGGHEESDTTKQQQLSIVYTDWQCISRVSGRGRSQPYLGCFACTTDTLPLGYDPFPEAIPFSRGKYLSVANISQLQTSQKTQTQPLAHSSVN
ncbi:Hypothetical predicted protein [Podarcis lilfordi]|uniref:Uncharacterized protein n=1 Tax=Podarcis lilfordi TaxID=74358 RepID=A0AA35PJS1_9SAUR|nr:Hypothetical predicted protein [Podarcis lilfordi]